MRDAEPPARRGAFRVSFDLPWRLDGAAREPDAPLVVALHGQGMDEDAFAVLLRRLFDLPLRFLVPRAPWPLELHREHRIGASWYPYDGNQDRFRRELGRTEAMLLGLLQAVESEQGLRPRRRAVLGFSQGGYCGAMVALRHPELFSRLVVSGARVKTEALLHELPRAAAGGFRVLLCHGLRDATVLPEAAERGREALAGAGIAVDLLTFDAGHTLGRSQVQAIRDWFDEHLVEKSGDS